MIENKIIGSYTSINKIDFPLIELPNFFSKTDLYYIFGNNVLNDYFFDELEYDNWSKHFIFKLNTSNRLVGYLRVIHVKGVVEIHGGGLHNSFIEKLALSEAWFLIIDYCFLFYNVQSIFTSCMINNDKAYKFIIGSGFHEINRNIIENRICFKLSINDFIVKKNKYLKKL